MAWLHSVYICHALRSLRSPKEEFVTNVSYFSLVEFCVLCQLFSIFWLKCKSQEKKTKAKWKKILRLLNAITVTMSCINYNKLRIRTFGRQKNKKQNKKYCRYDYTEIGKKKEKVSKGSCWNDNDKCGKLRERSPACSVHEYLWMINVVSSAKLCWI